MHSNPSIPLTLLLSWLLMEVGCIWSLNTQVYLYSVLLLLGTVCFYCQLNTSQHIVCLYLFLRPALCAVILHRLHQDVCCCLTSFDSTAINSFHHFLFLCCCFAWLAYLKFTSLHNFATLLHNLATLLYNWPLLFMCGHQFGLLILIHYFVYAIK